MYMSCRVKFSKFFTPCKRLLLQLQPQSPLSAFVKYTLYDGPDALIANKLLELGVTINPNNVDWYKRTLIEQQQRSRVAAVASNGGSA